MSRYKNEDQLPDPTNLSNSDIRYIVKRNNIRVSEEVHHTYEDAKEEYEYWENIIKKWPDGSVLEIEPL